MKEENKTDVHVFMMDPNEWKKEYDRVEKQFEIVKEFHSMTTQRVPNPAKMDPVLQKQMLASGLVLGNVQAEMIDVPVISSVMFIRKKLAPSLEIIQEEQKTT